MLTSRLIRTTRSTHSRMGKSMARAETYHRTTAAISVVLVISLARVAGAFELVGWDWSFQKQPVEGRFVFCKTNAPAGASQAIRDAAKKWEYAKFKFSFDADACPASPPPNYIEFGAVNEVEAISDFPNDVNKRPRVTPSPLGRSIA
jgi:hypothetical protein